MHETENGRWAGNKTNDGAIHDERDFSFHVNHPLPWVALAFIITIAVSVFSVYRVSQAEAEAAAAKQTAFNAETQCLLVRTYTDSLRIEMAAHGVKPPPIPKELK